MRIEAYAATRKQDGSKSNEDAFLILRGNVPVVALADGAGNAQSAGKKVLCFFERLVKEATVEQMCSPMQWTKWIKLMDGFLLEGGQSTFVGFSIVDGFATGACVGDSRAYYVDYNWNISIMTEAAPKRRLGSGEALPLLFHKELLTGDMVLLMSDGAWTPFGLEGLGNRIRHRGWVLADLPECILNTAGRNGHFDDQTCVAVRVKYR